MHTNVRVNRRDGARVIYADSVYINPPSRSRVTWTRICRGLDQHRRSQPRTAGRSTHDNLRLDSIAAKEIRHIRGGGSGAGVTPYVQSVKHGPESIFVLVEDCGNGVWRDLWSDYGGVHRSTTTRIRASAALIEGDNRQSVATRLEVRRSQDWTQRVPQEIIGSRQSLSRRAARHPDRTIVCIMIPVRHNDGKTGKRAVVYVSREMREVHDFTCRPVVIVGCGGLASRSNIGLRIDLPRNTVIVEFAEDVVVGDGI